MGGRDQALRRQAGIEGYFGPAIFGTHYFGTWALPIYPLVRADGVESRELQCALNRSPQMNSKALLWALVVSTVMSLASYAEQAPPPQERPCPESNSAEQSPRADNPSDRLARSKGVVCPPSGIDPDIQAKPPSGDGTIKVIPAPGTPGGDPREQPK